jgi:uncharacterized membrane protein (UPF0127 family)
MADGERTRLRKGPLGLLVAAALAAASGGALVLTVGLPGCDEQTAEGVERVRLGGKTFFLELAADNATRMRGLSGRDHIEPDGGMLFVFPDEQVAVQNFVMRDCPIDIDIIFLDPNGRVIAMHEMKSEEPRGEGEGEPGSTNFAYESRLKKYPSRFRSQFAIELRAGTLATLGLEEGDQIDLDVRRLKDAAR